MSINRGAGLQHHAPQERQTPQRTVAADPFLPPRLRHHMLMSRCGTRWWPPYLARYRSVASMKPIYSPAGIRYIMESGIIIIINHRQARYLAYNAFRFVSCQLHKLSSYKSTAAARPGHTLQLAVYVPHPLHKHINRTRLTRILGM